MTTAERLTRKDWLTTGLQLLGSEGEKVLTIERLCQVTGRTKGSFYHHFKNHDEFIQSLLEYWQLEYTNRIIMTVEQLESLSDRRRELDRLAAGIDRQIERAIRNWSGVDKRAQLVLKQVDEQRIQYLVGLVSQLGQIDEQMALEIATIEYSAFVGLQQLFPNADCHWLEQLFNRFNQMASAYCVTINEKEL
jgi:AcrR family transcriptional regulator